MFRLDPDKYEYFPAKEQNDHVKADQYQRVAIYARVSTDNPMQTTSFELQKKYYEELVAQHPQWVLVKIYADEGKSGTTMQHRDAFNEMHYPVFCYNGQFRRGADGTPLTYMLHGHIHKTEDQVLVDKFCAETRATMRKSAHQETAQPVSCQMINCFCMYSDYTPLTLEEWVECDQRRQNLIYKTECKK